MIVPGDSVQGTNFGPGVWTTPTTKPVATVPGELETTSNGATYILSNSRRYIPSRQDFVIGTITQKLSEIYRVQLQPHSRPCRLGIFAFEGANKKNRPQLSVGDVVYGRITHADSFTDADLECVDAHGKSNGFGQLVGGTLVHVSLGFARKLLFEGHPLLEQIGKKYTFELAIGVNGVVWIKTEDLETTMQVAEWIIKAELLSVRDALKLV